LRPGGHAVSVHCTDLDPFFDGELAPEARAAFLDHLTTCERCQEGLFGRAEEEEIVGGIGAQISLSPARVTPPEKTSRTVMFLAPIVAAAAVIAIWLEISGATLSLRGMANHGPMHWRGDRTGGNDAPFAQSDSGTFDERAAFRKFQVGFTDLLGRDSFIPQ